MTDGELVKLFFDLSERALEALEEKYGGLAFETVICAVSSDYVEFSYTPAY